MKQNKILTYSMGLALSNRYLEVIIQCLEPKILNEKVAVLFDFLFILYSNITSTFSLNISGSSHRMMTDKNLFDRVKSML